MHFWFSFLATARCPVFKWHLKTADQLRNLTWLSDPSLWTDYLILKSLVFRWLPYLGIRYSDAYCNSGAFISDCNWHSRKPGFYPFQSLFPPPPPHFWKGRHNLIFLCKQLLCPLFLLDLKNNLAGCFSLHSECYKTILSGHVTFTWRDLKAWTNSIYVMCIRNFSCSLRFRVNTLCICSACITCYD